MYHFIPQNICRRKICAAPVKLKNKPKNEFCVANCSKEFTKNLSGGGAKNVSKPKISNAVIYNMKIKKTDSDAFVNLRGTLE